MSRGRVSAVRASVMLAAVAVVSSCGANTVGSDVVAKVDDQTLTFDQLTAPTDPNRPAVASGDAVRAETAGWVQTQIASKLGVEELYATAAGELYIFCPDVLPPAEPTQEAVDAVVADVEANGWAAVAATVEAATGTSPAAPCQSIDGAPDALIAPLAATAPGDYAIFADQDVGYGVIRIRPFDEVDAAEFLQVVADSKPDVYAEFTAAAEDIDVYVNPRVGSFSPDTQRVDPIG